MAIAQRWLPLALGLALVGTAACGGPGASGSVVVDLVHELPSAERRATHPVDQAIRVIPIVVDGGSQPSLEIDSIARITWRVRMPQQSRFHTLASLVSASNPALSGVTIRIGIANDRFYEELARVPVPAPRQDQPASRVPIDVGLERYSGWKWSLFYQPGRVTWKLILNVDATPGGTVQLLAPAIVAR